MKILIYITLLLGLFADTTAMNEPKKEFNTKAQLSKKDKKKLFDDILDVCTPGQENSNNFKEFVLNTMSKEFDNEIILNEIKDKIDKVDGHSATLLKGHHLSAVYSYSDLNSDSKKLFLIGSKISTQHQKKDDPFDHILSIITVRATPELDNARCEEQTELKKITKIKPIAFSLYKIKPHPEINDYGRIMSCMKINHKINTSNEEKNILIAFEGMNSNYESIKSLMVINLDMLNSEFNCDIVTGLKNITIMPEQHKSNCEFEDDQDKIQWYKNRNSFPNMYPKTDKNFKEEPVIIQKI